LGERSLASVNWGRHTIRYEVLERAGRRTLTIEVHPDRRVVVRAPVGCPPALVAERVKKRGAWIIRQLTEFEGYTPRTPSRQYVSGESHLYLGRQYRLVTVRGDATGVSLTRGRLVARVQGEPQPARVRALLQAWYAERARAVFRKVLDEARPRFTGADPVRLLVRAMRTRWGSLSSSGTMTLNVDLIRAPRPCIEYVVTHELCHLTNRNHDRRFYGLLTRMMPDWDQRKRRLEMVLL
jgi:predicted metal-dependent hydrolase